MSRASSRLYCRLSLVVVVAALAAACAEPPSKEMNQAQGAIDAARAAGAEEYAADELKAAVDALAQSEEAVTANDYRLALAHALDSRESAQNAAKTAVDGRARARGDAERELAEATALFERAETRMKEPAVARLPRRTLTEVETQLDTVRTSLQEARTALEDERYGRVGTIASEASRLVQAQLTAIDDALAPSPRGRRR
ncbi:MAG: DUF4398 domain-containing protein [Vicinamibacterales bacterium]